MNTSDSTRRRIVLIASFLIGQACAIAVVAGPLLGTRWWEGFRAYFANDQMSYAAIATNVANGVLAPVEPFTMTGVSHYPSGWYVVLGLAARVTGAPVWVIWQVLGALAVMTIIATLGWIAWRVSRRAWAPLLPGLALFTGTLALRTSGDWFTLLEIGRAHV